MINMRLVNIIEIIATISLFTGFALLIISEFYLLYVLEIFNLDSNPFKEKLKYPGKARKVAKYYIKNNPKSEKKLKVFIYIENTSYLLMAMFFVLIFIALLIIA